MESEHSGKQVIKIQQNDNYSMQCHRNATRQVEAATPPMRALLPARAMCDKYVTAPLLTCTLHNENYSLSSGLERKHHSRP